MVTPESWVLASARAQDAFEEMKRAMRKLLIENGFTAEQAVVEVDKMRLPAFDKALEMAMEVSSRKAVQPDWLIIVTGIYMWVAACDRCKFSEEERPYHKVDIPDFDPVNDEVVPSPEHLGLIQEAVIKEIADAKAKVAAEAEQRAKRHAMEMAEVARAVASTQISGPAQVNKPSQAPQASSSGAGRGKPVGGAQSGRGGHAGRGGPAGRGAPAPPIADEFAAQRKTWGNRVLEDDEKKRQAQLAKKLADEEESRARGFSSTTEDPAFNPKVEEAFVPRETDDDWKVTRGPVQRSTITASSKRPELVLPGAEAREKVQKAADLKKKNGLAEASRQSKSKIARMGAASNPFRKYEMTVPDQDNDYMARYWDGFKKASHYPSDKGFTCSGRPWEVKIHMDCAKWYFGHNGQRISTVIRHISKFGKVKIYAIFEGEFLHVGLTTQLGEERSAGSAGDTAMFIMMVSSAFQLLAHWAMGLKAGSLVHFTDFLESQAVYDIEKTGEDVERLEPIQNEDKGKGKGKGKAVAEPNVSGGEAEARAEASKETRKPAKKESGKGAPLSAEDAARNGELEKCKKGMQSILEASKSNTARGELAPGWVTENAPFMKHLTREEVVECMAKWWRDNLGNGHSDKEEGEAAHFERRMREHLSSTRVEEGSGAEAAGGKTAGAETPMVARP